MVLRDDSQKSDQMKSAHEATEAALWQREEQFRLLVQSVTDYAIYTLDLEGRITSWNSGAERIKGYTADEIVGQHFSKFYTLEDRESGEPQRALDSAARSGRFESEAMRVRKDGTRFWANALVHPLWNAGVLVGFAKITRDVTDRKETQRALEEAREALFQSQKSEAIGQLTGGIAHDFNNLLTAVLGSLELLRKRLPDDRRMLRLIDNAVAGAKRGAALTQRMLAFARQQKLRQEAVDVPVLLGGMADLLRSSLGPAILIETRLPTSVPPVHTDANQLEMALLNLAVNARDAMPDGGQIVIEAHQEWVTGNQHRYLKPGEYVRLSVTDDGEGMDERTLQRAMDPFFTTKGVGKGTGLGLSMVKGLAEQSGGCLVLKSCKGEGTTVELWLPVSKARRQSAAPRLQAASEASRRSLVILAVDDDSLVLTNTADLLEDLGHTVLEATSGDEALAKLREEKVDLVISDVAMPFMTGTVLASAIEAEWPGLPIILASGYAEIAEPGVAKPRLAKPFTQADLERAIAALQI